MKSLESNMPEEKIEEIDPIVIEYIGLNKRQWGPVPAQDLTQKDLDDILEKYGFTKDNILTYGVALYKEV